MRASRRCCRRRATPTSSDATAFCHADPNPTHAGSTSVGYSQCSPSTRASLRRRRAAQRRWRRRRRSRRRVSTRSCSPPQQRRSPSYRAGAWISPPPSHGRVPTAWCSPLVRACARASAPSASSVSAPLAPAQARARPPAAAAGVRGGLVARRARAAGLRRGAALAPIARQRGPDGAGERTAARSAHPPLQKPPCLLGAAPLAPRACTPRRLKAKERLGGALPPAKSCRWHRL